MWTGSSGLHGNNRNRLRSVTLMALLVLASTGATNSSYAQETEILRIDVTLDEYSFVPDPVRIPAGREEVLVIRNVGRISHEFMAGRHPEDNDFGEDLFAGLHVNIEQIDGSEEGHSEHTEHGDHSVGDDHHDVDVGHAANGSDRAHETNPSHNEHHAQSDDEQHAHGAGHSHGTMVEAQVGQTFVMTFTLPEDRRGTWITGCFLPGHYEAGMHGTLIVE